MIHPDHIAAIVYPLFLGVFITAMIIDLIKKRNKK